MIIASRHAYVAFTSATDNAARDHAFDVWGASQDLTRATQPLVRGTRSMGGGLLPLCNARDVINARVPDATPEPAPVICDRVLTIGRTPAPGSPMSTAIVRERMRLSRQSFDRGLSGDFRPFRQGGRRKLLPLVTR